MRQACQWKMDIGLDEIGGVTRAEIRLGGATAPASPGSAWSGTGRAGSTCPTSRPSWPSRGH